MQREPNRRTAAAGLLAALCAPVLAQSPGAPAPNPSATPAAPPRPRTPAAAAAPVPQPWPTRPLRVLVGFPPGSVQDLSARAIAELLARVLGQPVVVENKPGASGTIAADQVAKATDLHTVGVMNNSQLTIARMLNPAVAYDPARDLMPVALIGSTSMLLVVSAAATGSTGNDALAWLRQMGGKASYGSPGTGTPGHLGMELLKARAGLDAQHVPYQGNPQIITALLGQQLHAALLPPGLALPHVRAGKLRAVGVTGEQRSLLALDQPTLRELGVQGADMELWTAMAGPASLPPAIRDKLAAAVIEVVKAEEARTRLLNAGWQATPSNHEGLRLRMKKDTAALGGIILLRGIRSDA
jgi:tripartite-type tricarboxylate transporter receptor subunit TctC